MSYAKAERPKFFYAHANREQRGFRWWSYINGRDALALEVSWLSGFVGVSYKRRENRRTFFLGVGLLALWITVPGRKYLSYGEDREISINLHGDALRWRLWCDPHSWSSDTPKWRDGSFNFVDFALGRSKCEHHTLEARDVLVPMPEKAYPAKAELQEWTWKRPRWFAKTIKRVHIDIPGGIPFPGKGENSWDCGDDATFGITCMAKSIPEGVGVLVGSVLKDRVRHGGWSTWQWPTKESA